jgi:hypothetical protein
MNIHWEPPFNFSGHRKSGAFLAGPGNEVATANRFISNGFPMFHKNKELFGPVRLVQPDAHLINGA